MDEQLKQELSSLLDSEETSLDKEELIQKILANKDLPDLMILDLMLPGIPGEQVLKEMNDNGLIKKVPVIILTAKGDEANLNNCVKVWGARCYFIKSDHSLDEIVDKIKKNCN